MEEISSAFSTTLNILKTMTLADVIDILIVTYLIYKAIWFVRKTNSYNLTKGVILILVLLWLSGVFELEMINTIIRKTVELGLIALVILFQPELRRLLERMGSRFSSGYGSESYAFDSAISQTVLACTDMASSKTGALIIFERNVSIEDVIATGSVINADITAELLKNMFFNKAPLHDGAVIIREGRIAAAGCVLPLTHSTNLSKDLGMRHRAGIGLSEQSDAVVVIVSEETGAISVAIEGMLKRHLTGATLDKLLRTELANDKDDSEGRTVISKIRKFFRVKNEENKSNEKNI